ncbi:ATM interactor [Erpetoichthys calabaricus]|uniref:ATM interactor n=1 Tax=Erpetoichthys calabaricus TaxID=27687 RepID=A0A8C4T3E6_ERPCA|nr:ATM interactor [Erpetoichthys calabaricus]
MAAPAAGGGVSLCRSDTSHVSSLGVVSQGREVIKPSITELTKEVRTNILCTVEGCGKILPNTPALSMHLLKSHRIQDGVINPTVRKDMKTSQKLYCCPIEGCPRGPNRPFSQFSLVKQHFMKMHAEKKHKCPKCPNSYSTEWDLKRHSEDCGKIYRCTCGCPYASRAALLSHIYRTGHEIPPEHRYPPVKKRKMEGTFSETKHPGFGEHMFQLVNLEQELTEVGVSSEVTSLPSADSQKSTAKKFLLPKPKVALVKVPVMQFAHLPIIVSSADCSVKPVVLAMDNRGSFVSTVHYLSQPVGTVIPTLDSKAVTLRDATPLTRFPLEPVNTGIQVNLEPVSSNRTILEDIGQRSKCISTNIQTEISYFLKGSLPDTACISNENSVSSFSQTDLSFSSQVLLPVSVETQTFPSSNKVTSSIGAQTDILRQTFSPFYGVSRETQTSTNQLSSEDRVQIDQDIICTDLFGNGSMPSYSVSTQTSFKGNTLPAERSDQHLVSRVNHDLFNEKANNDICFGTQSDLLPQHHAADNQTQTINLFSDLENILSDSISGHSLDSRGTLTDTSADCEGVITSVQEQNTGIDFDFEEFLNATHIQTQTDESDLGTLNSEPVLESLDIETQTDFLFFGNPAPNYSSGKAQSSYLGLEMFDTQTQTDLDFLLDTSSHIPLDSFLKQASLSMTGESSNTETQTEVPSILRCNSHHENQVKLSSTETQTTTSSFEGIGHLFLTSNETQTVMDDFLMADIAWNTMESHFSSVETQTCEELSSFFQDADKIHV